MKSLLKIDFKKEYLLLKWVRWISERALPEIRTRECNVTVSFNLLPQGTNRITLLDPPYNRLYEALLRCMPHHCWTRRGAPETDAPVRERTMAGSSAKTRTQFCDRSRVLRRKSRHTAGNASRR